MPPTDAGPTRRPPLALAAVAGVLLIARVVLGVTETRSAPELRASGGLTRPALVQWQTPGAGVAEARRAGKLVLYEFGAEWCGPCKRLEADVFADPRYAAQINATFVPIRLTDRLREEGRNPPAVDSLQRRYAVDAFPTLVVMNPKTGRFERQAGYSGSIATMEWLVTSAMAMGGPGVPLGAPPPTGRVDSVLTR